VLCVAACGGIQQEREREKKKTSSKQHSNVSEGLSDV
jgi:hypothetical protein